MQQKTLQGLSCTFQNVATRVRKHVWYQVFLYCSHLPETISLTARDKSHAMLKLDSEFQTKPLRANYQITTLKFHNCGINWKEIQAPGTHMGLNYQSGTWWKTVALKPMCKPPKLAVWYRCVMETRRSLCYRRFLGGSSAKDGRNPRWILGQGTSYCRIKPPVIFSQ